MRIETTMDETGQAQVSDLVAEAVDVYLAGQDTDAEVVSDAKGATVRLGGEAYRVTVSSA